MTAKPLEGERGKEGRREGGKEGELFSPYSPLSCLGFKGQMVE